MNSKGKKICEVLVSTVLMSLITPTLAWGYMIIESRLRSVNWHGGMEPGKLIVSFIYGSLLGLLTMGIFIVPSALVVSLVMASLKSWSLRAVGAILLAVVVCSSIASLVMDPMRSREKISFNMLDPVATKMNLMGILSGFAAALIAFWAIQRCRKRYQTAWGVTPQQRGNPTNRKLRIALLLALGTGVALALLGVGLFWFYPSRPGGSLHVFHISETQTFLTEEIALGKAGEALAIEGLATAVWRPYEFKRTTAPDGKPDRYLLRYNESNGKSGTVKFVNETNQMASCSVEIQLEGNRLTCRVFKRD